jgi:hypothetical protein
MNSNLALARGGEGAEPLRELEDCLNQFSKKINENSRLRGVLRGWDRVMQIEALDSADDSYVMEFADSNVVSLKRGSVDGAPVVMRGERELLLAIFRGATNPAIAFLDGTLQVFADDRDQIKLDAISLLIWD